MSPEFRKESIAELVLGDLGDVLDATESDDLPGRPPYAGEPSIAIGHVVGERGRMHELAGRLARGDRLSLGVADDFRARAQLIERLEIVEREAPQDQAGSVEDCIHGRRIVRGNRK